MAIKDRKRSNFPALLALASLILLILFLGYYFSNCLSKQLSMMSNQEAVLGVSTFGSSPSKNPVTNGETFNFAATIVGDQAGLLNATVLFNLTGQGVIGSNIQGPGGCLKLTDTTAACNNVNIDPNETIVWNVPVTASASCSQQSPATISLQTRLVATLVTSTSTATTNCVAATNTGGNGGSTPIPTQQPGTTTNTTNTTSGNTNTTNGAGAALPTTAASNIDFAGLACSKVSGIPLVFLLFIVWLILAAYYFIFRRR